MRKKNTLTLSGYHPCLSVLIGGFCLAASLLFDARAEGKEPEPVRGRRLCPGLIVVGDIDPGFTDAEKRLLCGDTAQDAIGKSWSVIPESQRKFHFATFLQDRGRFRPRFEQQGGEIVAFAGDPTRAGDLRAPGAPPELRMDRMRGVKGTLLTPALLTRVEDWALGKLRAKGYPCPRAKSKADPQTGEIVVEIEEGPMLPLARVEEDGHSGLAPGMLRRYDAFVIGERYDADLLGISASRIQSQGLLQSVHYDVRCEAGGAVVREETMAGPPRVLGFGVGIDTEGILLGKATWKNTRLGRSGSLFDVTARGSVKEQELESSFTWYHLPYPSRRYAYPGARFRHQNEQHYEIADLKAWGHYGTSLDTQAAGFAIRGGPSWNSTNQFDGIGPDSAQYGSAEAELRLVTHDYEQYQRSPRRGFRASLRGAFTSRGILADFSAQRLGLSFEGLVDPGEFDPPLLVLAARGGVQTTLTPGRPDFATLPAPFRYWLGGSQTIRGFGREELPDDDYGRLTAAYLGLEGRLGNLILPLNLQPFVFIDAGAFGRYSPSLAAPIFWSPGLGIRWESPVGTIRTTFAHGYETGNADSRLSHFQFFLSLGEEF